MNFKAFDINASPSSLIRVDNSLQIKNWIANIRDND